MLADPDQDFTLSCAAQLAEPKNDIDQHVFICTKTADQDNTGLESDIREILEKIGLGQEDAANRALDYGQRRWETHRLSTKLRITFEKVGQVIEGGFSEVQKFQTDATFTAKFGVRMLYES